MDFAKKLMEKYGWKEGTGLGKNQSGICKPLKPHLKFDTSGLGVDKASDFNNHWWERVFNEASSNINVVNTDQNDIKLNIRNDKAVEITTKEYSINKLRNQNGEDYVYDNFLRSSTLANTGVDANAKDSVQNNEIEMNKFKPLSDAELFAVCGGRTAHKGARHGLKLCGKLSRIEKQEKKLLKRMKKASNNRFKNIEPNDDSITLDDFPEVKSKKLKRNKHKKSKKTKSADDLNSSLNAFSINEPLLGISDNSKIIKKNKSKKKRDKRSNVNEPKLVSVELSQDDDIDIQEQVDSNDFEYIPANIENNTALSSKKMKKKLEKLKEKIAKSKVKNNKKLKKKYSAILDEFDNSIKIKPE